MKSWRRSRGIVLLVLLIVVVPGLLRQPGAAARLCGADHEAIDGEEAELLRIINSYRADNGAHPLSISPILTAAAAWMAEDLATHSYFSHTDSLGRSPYQRAVDCGYGTGAGENLAAGTSWSSASAAFAAWRASPGHNANMLGAFYREIGIARYYRDGSPYGWYWVTTFGTGSQQQPTPAPTPTPAAPPSPATAPTAVPPQPSPSPAPPAPPPAPPSQSPPPADSPVVTATPSVTLRLSRGLNLVVWPGDLATPVSVLGGYGTIRAVYAPAPGGGWLRYFPELPAWLDTLRVIEHGQPLWIIASRDTAVPVPAQR